MSASIIDDANLVEQAIEGNRDAFGELYLRHMDAIYRYIFYRIGEQCDAEDLTEQVFLNAWSALPRYELTSIPFTSWLYRIAHNVTINYFRKHKLSVSINFWDEIISTEKQVSPLEKIIETEKAQELANAISRLPEEHQQVIILRFIEGLAHSQVADYLGKSAAASRVLQHRALANLAKILGKQKKKVSHERAISSD